MSRQGFWARRQAALQEARDDNAPVELPAESPAVDPANYDTEAELLAALNLPDPDNLGAGDDFSAFMQTTVPDFLRNRALRRLWVSNPVLANVDGLLDYAEDFTDAATVVPDMQTSYRIGKGMQKHLNALLQQTPDDAANQQPEDLREEPREEIPGGSPQVSPPLDGQPNNGQPDKLSNPEPDDSARPEPAIAEDTPPAKAGFMKFEFT